MILVVAYGNPLRGDDGVAWSIAEALEHDRGTEVLCRHQLGPELAPQVSTADGVLFIDAARQGQPGQVQLLPVVPGPPESGLGHALTPAPLLDLAARVYGAAPLAFLLAVSGRDFGFGTELSSAVRAALPSAQAAARAAVSRLAEAVPQPRGGISRSRPRSI